MRGVRTAAVAALVAALAGVRGGSQRAVTPSQLTERAPDLFSVRLDTTKGPVVVEVHRDWSPHGADRFFNLVKAGFYDQCRFFRVIERSLVQFGINSDPAVQKSWTDAVFPDDPVRQSNRRGFVSFANWAQPPNARTTQVFINLADNTGFDLSAAPFGRVTSGMETVDAVYSGYAGAPQRQIARVIAEGNAFLSQNFPKLDSINTATIER